MSTYFVKTRDSTSRIWRFINEAHGITHLRANAKRFDPLQAVEFMRVMAVNRPQYKFKAVPIDHTNKLLKTLYPPEPAPPEKTRIVIDVSGGVVQAVFLDNGHQYDVRLVDWDNIEGGETEQFAGPFMTHPLAEMPKSTRDLLEIGSKP